MWIRIIFLCLLFILGIHEIGLYLGFSIIKIFLPGSLAVEDLSGNLSSRLDFKNLIYKHDNIVLKINNAHIKWHFIFDYHMPIVIDDFDIDNINLSIAELEKSVKNNNIISKTKANDKLQNYTIPTKKSYLPNYMPNISHGFINNFIINVNNNESSLNKIVFTNNANKALESWQMHINMHTDYGHLGINIMHDKYKNKLELLPIDIHKYNIKTKIFSLNCYEGSKDCSLKGDLLWQNFLFNIHGNLDFHQGLKTNLNIQANNLLVVNTDEYQIKASPNIIVTIKDNIIKISGEILIPEATLKPQAFNDATHLSADAVFIDKTPKPKTILDEVYGDINIVLGDKVEVKVQGLTGNLVGKINVTKNPNDLPQAYGILTLHNGRYKAHGQNLKIAKAQLRFKGTNIENPYLYIKAVRTIHNKSIARGVLDFNAANLDTLDFGQNITVGLEIEGPVSSTKKRLFSVPATLSQADILSFLLLGKPAHQASQSGGQLLMSAISAMDLDEGSQGLQLLSQLKSTLGIEIDVENGSSSNQNNNLTDNTTFVFSKSLSKRLKISYNVGLLKEDSNVLILTYLLNKFLSLQVSASDNANGLDILYTHQGH